MQGVVRAEGVVMRGRLVVILLGLGRGLRGFGREDPVREASILEGVRGLGLVRRLGRNWARLARSRTARLGRRLRLVALPRVGLLGLRLIALRLRLIGLLGREGIGEVWCGVASRRGTRGL